jgi:hypothetical protein
VVAFLVDLWQLIHPKATLIRDRWGVAWFIAAGTGGVQVLSATTGNVVGSVARPDPASLGTNGARALRGPRSAYGLAGKLTSVPPDASPRSTAALPAARRRAVSAH